MWCFYCHGGKSQNQIQIEISVLYFSHVSHSIHKLAVSHSLTFTSILSGGLYTCRFSAEADANRQPDPQRRGQPFYGDRHDDRCQWKCSDKPDPRINECEGCRSDVIFADSSLVQSKGVNF